MRRTSLLTTTTTIHEQTPSMMRNKSIQWWLSELRFCRSSIWRTTRTSLWRTRRMTRQGTHFMVDNKFCLFKPILFKNSNRNNITKNQEYLSNSFMDDLLKSMILYSTNFKKMSQPYWWPHLNVLWITWLRRHDDTHSPSKNFQQLQMATITDMDHKGQHHHNNHDDDNFVEPYPLTLGKCQVLPKLEPMFAWISNWRHMPILSHPFRSRLCSRRVGCSPNWRHRYEHPLAVVSIEEFCYNRSANIPRTTRSWRHVEPFPPHQIMIL